MEAHILELVPNSAQPTSERALRPLWWFIKNDHGRAWRMAAEMERQIQELCRGTEIARAVHAPRR
jgi:hypothetical protein